MFLQVKDMVSKEYAERLRGKAAKDLVSLLHLCTVTPVNNTYIQG